MFESLKRNLFFLTFDKTSENLFEFFDKLTKILIFLSNCSLTMENSSNFL